MPEPPEHTSSELADQLDDALKALWDGESDALDDLLDTDPDEPGIGAMLHAVVRGPAGPSDPLPEVKQIGPYRILGELGRGGMGVVYHAEQQQPRRDVALKVVRGSNFDPFRLRLFQREVQTLARLNHPNIAAIYEAGATDDGSNFFAMELVRGKTLVNYANERSGDSFVTRDRVRLFMQVCDAIHYAHQRGVIHRDLKPSNVIVDESGQPKVLDFGLARITADDDDTGPTIMTETGRVMGTLAYMSPEQARGNRDEIDLRADVYSLGVILFEMLGGMLPYDVTRVSLTEALRVICDESPRRLSTVNRRVDTELDTIVRKALEKDRERRYQSVAALKDDLERHMSGQPISARPPSAAYQLRKLIARHRVMFGAAVVVFALVTALAVVSTLSATRIEQKRVEAVAAAKEADEARNAAEAALERERIAAEQARRSALTAERTSEFLQSILYSASPDIAVGEELTAREVLDQAADRIESELTEEPAVAGAIHSTVGMAYLSLSLYEEAEKHLQEALAIQRTLEPPNLDELLSALQHLGVAVKDGGDVGRAEEYYLEALELARANYDEHDVRVLASLNNLAVLNHARGEYQQSAQQNREIIAAYERNPAENADKLITAKNNLSLALIEMSAFDEAEQLTRDNIEKLIELYGEDHPKVLRTQSNLGLILYRQRKVDESIAVLEPTLDASRRVLGDAHLDTLSAMMNLADSYSEVGRNEEAIEMLERGLVVQKELLGEDHPQTLASMNNLAQRYRLAGRYENAEEMFRSALAVLTEVLGPKHPNTLVATNNLAQVVSYQGRNDEAEPLYRQVMDGLTEVLGPEHENTLAVTYNYACLLQRLGEYDEAIPIFQRVVETADAVFPEDDWRRGMFRINYGTCLTNIDRLRDAEPLLLEADRILAAKLGLEHEQVLKVRENLVQLYEDLGTPEKAGPFRPATQPAEETVEATP